MTRTKSNIRRLLVRIIAGLLVLSMIPGLVMFSQTGISTGASGDANRSVRLAAQQLLENDPYARRSRIRRMSDFARNLLKTKRSAEDYELAAQIAIAQGKYDEALAFQEKALDVFEGSEEEFASQYLRMGYLYAVLGEYAKAENWLNLGIAVTPYVEAVLTRAQVRLNLNDTEGALQDVDACYETVGDETSLLPDMVNIYEAAGAYETAVRLWKRVLDAGGSSDYLLDRAYCYVELGQMTEAEADAGRYLETHGDNAAAAYTMLGMGFLRAGEYKRADEYFAKALSGGESDPWSLYYYVVLCAYLTGDYERASDYGTQLIDRMRQGETVGAAQLGIEDVTGKMKVGLKPVDYAQLCRMTGASQMMRGQYAQAAETLTLSLNEKNDPDVRYLRGSSLLAEERYEEALKDFTAAERGGADRERCRYGSGVCRMQLDQTREAVRDFTWVTENGKDETLREEAARQIELLQTGSEKKP